MFWKILRKDLKRKKTMNVLLLIFITLTATLLGASINMLSTNSTAVKKFIKKAEVADYTAINYYSDENIRKATDWVNTSKNVQDASMDTFILLMKTDIQVPDGMKPVEFENAMALEVAPQKDNLVFDENNHPLKVEAGEIAIPYAISQTTGVKIGDVLTITIEEKVKTFRISHYIKDAFCGSPMMGFNRWVINAKDYAYLDSQKAVKFTMLKVNSNEGVDRHVLAKEFNQLGIPSLSTISGDLVETSYLLSTVIAGVLMAISILLILISFLILRFTIGYTLQEDYKEIGIMKAIGLKGGSIQGIYMVKYLAMGVVGGTVGYLLSLPLCATFINIVCSQMVIDQHGWWSFSSFIGVVLIIALTMLFCRLCTRKLNKFSAIDAIRGGSTGERYYRLKAFHLKRSRVNTTTFLAASDLFHGGRKYAALFISFILATIVLIVPLNAIHTLKSPALLDLFAYPDFDFTVNMGNTNDIMFTYTTEEMLAYVDDLKKQYQEKGLSVDLFPEVNYMCQVYKDDVTDSKNIYTAKTYGVPAKEYKVSEGVAPVLPNEIAITKQIADYFHVGIGDTIHVQLVDQVKEYIITGTYSSMINMGESIRLSEQATTQLKGSAGMIIMGRYQGKEGPDTYMKQIRKATPDGRIKSAKEFIYEMMGNIVDTLDQVNIGILAMVACIMFLITVLVAKMLMTKEASDVAVLKSLGFKNKSLRGLQIKRMVLLLVSAIIIGTLLADLIDEPLASIIYNMMGASNLSLVVDPLQVYFIYPGILLVVTVLATFISTADIKRIQVWEFNNQE